MLSTEELECSPADTLRRATSFLQLRDCELKEYRKFNAIPYPPMPEETRRELAKFYRPHNQKLYKLLGRDLGWDRDISGEPAESHVASEEL